MSVFLCFLFVCLPFRIFFYWRQIGTSSQRHVTCDISHVTSDMWHMTSHDIWHAIWHMIFDTWDVTKYMWQNTCYMWHTTCDTWHVFIKGHLQDNVTNIIYFVSWPNTMAIIYLVSSRIEIFYIFQKKITALFLKQLKWLVLNMSNYIFGYV